MDWDNNMCLRLIDEYRTHRCLWDPTCEEYKNIAIRDEAWRTISWAMNGELAEVKKKMESLLASFRRERIRSATVENYKTKWFAYRNMKFLLPKYESKNKYSANKSVEYDDHDETVDNQFAMEDHHPSTSNFNRPKKELSPPPPRWEEYRPPREHKPQKRKIAEDPWIDEAYKILKSSISHDKDDCAVFGEYIATKLRRYSPYTKSTVEHLISNILFNAEIGKYDDIRKQRSTSATVNGSIDCTDDS